MPDLPTITVTAPQAQAILEAYGTVADYKAWLRREVREYVYDFRVRQATEDVNAARRTAIDTARAELTDLQEAVVEEPPAEPAP